MHQNLWEVLRLSRLHRHRHHHLSRHFREHIRAVAMTFASIFYLAFWFLSGIVSSPFLGAFWRLLWLLRASLRVLWGSFGGPWSDFLGSLELLLAAEAYLRGSLGVPEGSWDVPSRLGGDFQDLNCLRHYTCSRPREGGLKSTVTMLCVIWFQLGDIFASFWGLQGEFWRENVFKTT